MTLNDPIMNQIFNQQTQNELKKSLKLEFYQLDHEKSGEITQEALFGKLQSKGVQLSTRDKNALISACKRASGKINYGEAVKMIYLRNKGQTIDKDTMKDSQQMSFYDWTIRQQNGKPLNKNNETVDDTYFGTINNNTRNTFMSQTQGSKFRQFQRSNATEVKNSSALFKDLEPRNNNTNQKTLNHETLSSLNRSNRDRNSVANKSDIVDLSEVSFASTQRLDFVNLGYKKAEQRKKSAFSDYYLDGKHKNLAHLRSVASSSMDNYQESLLDKNENNRTNSLPKIGSLHDACIVNLKPTFKGTPSTVSSITGVGTNKKTFMDLSQKMMSIISKYKIDHQQFNGLRYECLRQDKYYRTAQIPLTQFMTLFRKYNIKLNLQDQKYFFDLLKINATKNNFNLNNLNKFLELIAKFNFRQLKEEQAANENNGQKNNKNKKKLLSVLANLTENIQTKLKIAFQSANEAFRFFDIANTEMIKPEHFVLGVKFFNSQISLADCMQLFETLDTKKDGLLDENEFDVLYIQEGQQTGKKEIDGLSSVAASEAVAFNQYRSANQTDLFAQKTQDASLETNMYKMPRSNEEILDLPYFLKLKQERMKQTKRGAHQSVKIKSQSKQPSRKLQILKTQVPEAAAARTSAKAVSTVRSSKNNADNLMRESLQDTKQTFDAIQTREKFMPQNNKMNELVNHQYMVDYATLKKNQERMNFLNKQLSGRKPIFTNFIDNNTNILRGELQRSKLQKMKDQEAREMEIIANLERPEGEYKYRNYNAQALENLKPERAIQRLIKTQNAVNSMNASKRASSTLDHHSPLL